MRSYLTCTRHGLFEDVMHVACLKDSPKNGLCGDCSQPIIPPLRDTSDVAVKLRQHLVGLPWVPSSSLGDMPSRKPVHVTPREAPKSVVPAVLSEIASVDLGLDATTPSVGPSPHKASWSHRSSDPDNRANMKHRRAVRCLSSSYCVPMTLSLYSLPLLS